LPPRLIANALDQIRASNGTVLEADRGFALKLDRSQLVHLAALSDVGSLDLAQSSLTDEDLTCLRPLHELVFLDLSENPISDGGLEFVERCEKLRFLALQDTAITSLGLEQLTRMTKLESLVLDRVCSDVRIVA
jgi:Leucine-rich repeat (LRR) protein